jgi:transmembrane sensor
MDKKKILELLRKHSKGTATAEERNFLMNLYDMFASETDAMDLLNADEKQELKQDIQKAIWEKIQQQEQTKDVVVMKASYLRKVAAVVFFVVCAAGVLFYTRDRHAQNNVVTSKIIRRSPNFFVVLKDGSRVILSYGSKLTYAPGFAKREVYLSGKAYFDIKHDAARPFIVHTGNVFTTVLGTAFNIEALPGDKTITVTVTRGKVKVNDENKLIGVIVPNQQIIYNKNVERSTKNHITAAVFTGWTTENNLYLEDVSVAEAVRLFEERFKVKIVFGDDSIKNKHFTTSFDSAASLDQALRSTCAFNDATYSYNKERTLITINAKPIN